MSTEDEKCKCNCDRWEDNDWKTDVAKIVLGGVLILSSMVGLYYDVEYSGWVMVAGILLIL